MGRKRRQRSRDHEEQRVGDHVLRTGHVIGRVMQGELVLQHHGQHDNGAGGHREHHAQGDQRIVGNEHAVDHHQHERPHDAVLFESHHFQRAVGICQIDQTAADRML